MSRMVTRLAVAAVVLCAGSIAQAGAGNGIRVGGSEGRLHPFLELEARYDSNVYFTYSPSLTGGTSAGDAIIHVRPGLKLSVPGDAAALDLSALIDWAQYLGADNSQTSSDLSKLYAEATLGLTVNGRGVVSLEVDDTFRRSDRPESLSLGAGLVSNYNALSVRVPFRPGGGALTLGLNGGWALESFESFLSGQTCAVGNVAGCDSATLSKLGYNEVRGGADIRWKFLPRTSAVFEATYFSRLPNDTALSTEVSGLRVSTGITGLVTAHMAGTLKVGYGDTFGSAGPEFRTWLLTAEAEWIPTEASSVKLSYGHDLGADPGQVFGLFNKNRVALDAKALFGGRFLLRGLVSWDRLDYAGSSDSTQLLVVQPSVGAELARWLRLELAYAYTDRSSSLTDFLATQPPGTTEPPGFTYTKHEVWLKAVVTY